MAVVCPDKRHEHDAPQHDVEQLFQEFRPGALACLVSVAKNQGKDSQREPSSEQVACNRPLACAVLKLLAHRKRECRSHGEEEEREHKVNPCYAGIVRVECVCRWGSLAVEHPARKVGTEADVGAQDHSEDRDSAKNVDCCDSFVHDYLDITLL